MVLGGAGPLAAAAAAAALPGPSKLATPAVPQPPAWLTAAAAPPATMGAFTLVKKEPAPRRGRGRQRKQAEPEAETAIMITTQGEPHAGRRLCSACTVAGHDCPAKQCGQSAARGHTVLLKCNVSPVRSTGHGILLVLWLGKAWMLLSCLLLLTHAQVDCRSVPGSLAQRCTQLS